MSITTSARLEPRTTACPWRIIISSVTGTVVSSPCMTMPKRIADQKKLDQIVRHRRRMRVIGGQRDDRLAALASLISGAVMRRICA